MANEGQGQEMKRKWREKEEKINGKQRNGNAKKTEKKVGECKNEERKEGALRKLGEKQLNKKNCIKRRPKRNSEVKQRKAKD